MSLLQTGIAKSGAAADYTIDNSLRFNSGDSAYLIRTMGTPTNNKKWTLSTWFKMGDFGQGQFLSAGGNQVFVLGTGQFEFAGGASGTLERMKTTRLFRDPGAWYHIVFSMDTTQSAFSDQMKLYVNGEQVTDFDISTAITQNDNTEINSAIAHSVGRYSGGSEYWDGYLAEYYFVDGSVLDADDFGELDSDTNQWIPLDGDDVKDAVTFGTNGFYQKYAGTELANSFADSADKNATPTTVTTQTAQKKFGTASALSVNNASGLQIPQSPDWVFSGPFTIELWVRITDAASDITIFDHWLGSGDNRVFQITYSATESGRHRFQWSPNGTSASAVNVDYTSVLSADTWYHIAWCRDGDDDLRFFVDGTQVGSTATTVTGAAYDGDVDLKINIGSANGGDISNYMDEIRISNSARYTDDFDVATSAFTTDGNTKLLLHCDGSDDGTSFPDSSESANRHDITASGDVANVRGGAYTDGATVIESHTSTGSITWTCPIGVTSVDYLVVGGGGGGGHSAEYSGGGGGAGGYRAGTGFSVTPGTGYTITVGAGGAAGSSSLGTSGGDSTFSTITSAGGGGGGFQPTTPAGLSGGSGGGGAYNAGLGGSGNTPSTSPVQGYAGGRALSNGGMAAAGGGGGAGEVGEDGSQASGSAAQAGDGGDGVANSITGSSVYYAGGGAGCANTLGVASGGNGGGGDTSTAGTDGLGGGGGGGANAEITRPAGAGGSGIVILSYTNSKPGSSSIEFDGTGDYLTTSADTDFNFTGDFTVDFWFNMTDFTARQFFMGYYVGESDYCQIGARETSGSNDITFWYTSSYNLSTGTVISGTGWHHLALVRSGTTVSLAIDGVFDASTVTISGTVYFGQSQSGGQDFAIGERLGASSEYFGYMDEIRFSDSARWTSDFTPETTAYTADANTKLLIHSNWDGGLGADSSGNYNTFTPTNLVATDQMVDTPTNNFATMNPLALKSLALSEGNLKATASGGGQECTGTLMPQTGKWYFELYLQNLASNVEQFGITRTTAVLGSTYLQGINYRTDGYKFVEGTDTAGYGSTWTTGDVMGAAIDLDANTIIFYKNNASQGSLSFTTGHDMTPMIRMGASGNIVVMNFGSDSSFAGNKTAQGNQDDNDVGDFYYEPPSGYLALCTDNLSAPEIALPGEYHNAKLYTGNATETAYSGIGFEPDWIWFKSRGGTGQHVLIDSVRGVTEFIHSDQDRAERTDSDILTSFDSDGFTVGDDAGGYGSNINTETYVAWTWKAGGAASSNGDGDITSSVSANTTAGFSIVSYTGDGDNTSSVGHGLATTPGMILLKALTGTHNWIVWHKDLTATTAYSLYLNTDGAETNNVSYWYDAAPNATTFHPGDGGASNGSGTAYIAYCFESIEGYSKVGSYTGNNNADGPFIYTGFKPAFTIVKLYSHASYGWVMMDDARDTYNVMAANLRANTNAAETDGSEMTVDYTSNGFKIRNTNNAANGSAYSYIYLAFAESPFKYSNAR